RTVALQVVVQGEVCRPGVYGRPLQQATPRERLHGGEALRGTRIGRELAHSRRRDSRIHDDIGAAANTLYDTRIDICIFFGLAARFVVGVRVNDGRTGLRACDRLLDDLLNRDRDAWLAPRPPRTIERNLQPGLLCHRPAYTILTRNSPTPSILPM